MSFLSVHHGNSDPRMPSRDGHKAAQSQCEVLAPRTCITLIYWDQYNAYASVYSMGMLELSVILKRRAGCMQSVSRKWEPKQGDAEKRG